MSLSAAESHRNTLLEILSDARVAAPMVRTADYHSQANPKSYFYVFKHLTKYADFHPWVSHDLSFYFFVTFSTWSISSLPR